MEESTIKAPEKGKFVKVLTPKEFKALPKEKQKVLIMKDVILQVETAKFCVKKGKYLEIERNSADVNDSAREAILENKIKCSGCARAAMFISAVKFLNKLEVRELTDYKFNYITDSWCNSRASSFIGRLFNKTEQRIIETVFEGTEGFIEHNNALRKSALEYREKLEKKHGKLDTFLRLDEYILIQICKNVIRNKGTLKLD